MSTINFYARSADLMVSGSEDLQTSYLLPVAQAFRDGTMTYNAEARDGKGGFKGASVVEQNVVNSTTRTLPKEFRSTISRAATVIRGMAPSFVQTTKGEWTVSDDDLETSVRQFIADHGSISSLYAALTPSEKAPKEPRTLIAIIAAMLAETRNAEYGDADVVAELLAQVSPAE